MEYAVAINKREQFFLLQLVHFVEQQKDRASGFLHQFQYMLVPGAELLGRIHNQQDQVATVERIVNLAHHLAVQAAVRPMDAGSIDKDDLPGRPAFLRFYIDRKSTRLNSSHANTSYA